ncbi:hypothetical protein E2P81_ATG09192 [Venturia nashicola]|uniref:Uncharacterized protein n=1 Tax=Venturia nashicola TaxID=86259 RepID=A0A4Z1NNK3_9PEZI|nr:hypothetical protein E6O75_ATG09392 [Venturia nashicola]TLD20122.1 hypothetical protein E2P81_ATG09192 [Venturia nashicola]
MTKLFSSPPKGRATSPATARSEDEWSNMSYSDKEADVWSSSDSDEEDTKAIHTPTSSVCLSSSSNSEKEASNAFRNTSFHIPEMDLSPEDQASLDLDVHNHKTPAMTEPKSELAKMVEKCNSLAEKAAHEVDAIARALSRKLDKCPQFRTSMNNGSTPEQSFRKCERFRDDAGRLYKRFDRQARAAWSRLEDEVYAKYGSIQSECETAESNHRQLRRKAATAHRLDATVANYAKWKDAKSDDKKKRMECRRTDNNAWGVFIQMRSDAWEKYELEKEEAHDAYERVSAEYKRAKSLMSEVYEWSDLPEWKRIALFVGIPAASIFAIIAVANVWDFLTNPAPNSNICSKAIGEMARAVKTQQVGLTTEQKWSLLWEMLEKH